MINLIILFIIATKYNFQHTRKTVQEEIAKQPWENQFETVLGTDRYGARYIYFPQFLKSDLRIYRHCLDNKILSTVKVCNC